METGKVIITSDMYFFEENSIREIPDDGFYDSDRFQGEWEIFLSTGFFDKNKREIFYGDLFDEYFGGKIINQGIVSKIMVAHWLIDEDKMNLPMSRVEITGHKFKHQYSYD